MAGALTISTLNDSSGVLATQNGMTGIAKAWVNYNAVAQTISGSFNVSSVTYVSTGTFTINFTTSMPNANYAIAACASTKAGNGATLVTVRETGIGGTNPSTTNFQLSVRAASFADIDMPYVFAQVFSS
jgi:hypothetical protein